MTLATVVAAPLLLAACAPTYITDGGEPETAASCDTLLSNVVGHYRSGDLSGDIDADLDALGNYCSAEYDIATDYFATAGLASKFGPDPCDSLLERDLRPKAVQLLAEDGLCAGAEAMPPAAPNWPNDGLGWDEARGHVGSYQRVCGPLTSTRSISSGAFVNIGRDYPSQDRFTFVIWGDWWLEPIASGTTVCAAGTIYLYEGVTQIELSSPDELEVWS